MKNPTSSSRRGERRRRNEVRVRRAVRLLTGSGWLPDQARKCADHMKSCSCFMCCNPRRTEGPTLQEKRSNLALQDEN